jgi:hypothetical protein
MTNAVNDAVNRAVYLAVTGAVVSDAVVSDAVYLAVRRAVFWDVRRAVNAALRDLPDSDLSEPPT